MIKILMASFLVLATSLSIAQTGLKKVNFQDETSDSKEESATSAGLSPEEAHKLKADIEKVRARQAESQKALDELDADE